jgi:putative peptide maturation dehydrogenase
LTGETAPLEPSHLQTLFSIPQGSWVEVEYTAAVGRLCERGLLLSEDDAELRRRDEQLAADEWLPEAAAYHFSTRFGDADLQLPDDMARVAATADEAAVRFVERHGPPPPHFHSVGGPKIELPLVRREGGLYDSLARRRTTRGFDADRPIASEELVLLLYEIFGCRAYARIHPDVVALRKSSPSGGGLHPIEVYPLIRNVDGIAPGLYHYAVGEHALEPVSPLDVGEATAAIGAFTAGQTYFSSAAAVLVLTARFARSFWKYRRHPTAYATILFDAAHLSQSFYLVCAELGLGAFFTNVINRGRIDDALGLDGYREGALCLFGCGVPSAAPSPLEPEFLPYVRGKSAL